MIGSATALVPAHNEAGTIVSCVRAIQDSSYPLVDIIVVADACTDDTAELAREAGATVYETDCADKAGAQNAVLDLILTDLVVGFDGDTLPARNCIARMVREMWNRDLDAVCATVLPIQPKGFFIRSRRYAYALGRRTWRAAQSAIGRVQVLTGAAYVFKTEAIKAIGGFPTVGISADMDATWTLHRAGYRLAYVGNAIAYTYDPQTFSEYRSQMRRWAAGYFQTMAKHKRQLGHWRAMLVVWTMIFDLLTLPITYATIAWWAATDPYRLRWVWAYVLGHVAVNTILAATVIGPREALLGAIPYYLVNYYNKGLYLWTLAREWVLGRHYGSWTGRHGRPTVIRPMTDTRRYVLASAAAWALTFAAVWGHMGAPRFHGPSEPHSHVRQGAVSCCLEEPFKATQGSASVSDSLSTFLLVSSLHPVGGGRKGPPPKNGPLTCDDGALAWISTQLVRRKVQANS